MRVAAATTTFTVGITSSAALIVFALQGRIDPSLSVTVIAGILAGGQICARFQARLGPRDAQRPAALGGDHPGDTSMIELREPIPPGELSSIRGRWQRPALKTAHDGRPRPRRPPRCSRASG
jgi:hypothetical protein